MADYKFSAEMSARKCDGELLGCIAQLLDTNGIPAVLMGHAAIWIYEEDIGPTNYSFVVPDGLIDKARDVLAAANFPPCSFEKACWRHSFGVPRPYAHFEISADCDFAPGFAKDRCKFSLELHKKSEMIWTLPDPPLGTPAPDDPNYTLASNETFPRKEKASRSWMHQVKVLTIPRFAEAMTLLHYRDNRVMSISQGKDWVYLLSLMAENPRLDLDKLQPQIRHHYHILRTAMEPKDFRRMYLWSHRVSRLMREAGELPRSPYLTEADGEGSADASYLEEADGTEL